MRYENEAHGLLLTLMGLGFIAGTGETSCKVQWGVIYKGGKVLNDGIQDITSSSAECCALCDAHPGTHAQANALAALILGLLTMKAAASHVENTAHSLQSSCSPCILQSAYIVILSRIWCVSEKRVLKKTVTSFISFLAG